MTEQHLKNLIAFINNKDYMVMWNDGYGKYCVLGNSVLHQEDQALVHIKNFYCKNIDLYNCVLDDFLIFRKEKMTDILEGMKS